MVTWAKERFSHLPLPLSTYGRWDKCPWGHKSRRVGPAPHLGSIGPELVLDLGVASESAPGYELMRADPDSCLLCSGTGKGEMPSFLPSLSTHQLHQVEELVMGSVGELAMSLTAEWAWYLAWEALWN